MLEKMSKDRVLIMLLEMCFERKINKLLILIVVNSYF